MKKNKVSGLKIAAVAAASAGVAVFSAVDYLFRYALGRSGGGGKREVALHVERGEGGELELERVKEENCERQRMLTEPFVKYAREQEQIIIRSARDGLTLTASCLGNQGGHLWVLLVHGYRSSYMSMLNYAQRYYGAGYHILAPNLRACGGSDGKYVGMGWTDRKDMLEWIDWILRRDPKARIVIHGISMGAATVMMTSGEKTPDAVRAFVEDCGFTSAWDMFSSEMRLRFHLPEFPLLYLTSALCKVRAGYGFREASALKQVQKCKKPMLFIHGDQDDFVPFSMLDTLYEAKPGCNKRKLAVHGAGHVESSLVLGDKYWEAVFAFLAPYMGEKPGESEIFSK